MKRLELALIGVAALAAIALPLWMSGFNPREAITLSDCAKYGGWWTYECNTRFASLLQAWASVAGVLVAILTIFLIWRTFRETEKSADAASRTIRTMMRGERAFLSVSGPISVSKQIFKFVDGKIQPRHPHEATHSRARIEFAAENTGKTAAIVQTAAILGSAIPILSLASIKDARTLAISHPALPLTSAEGSRGISLHTNPLADPKHAYSFRDIDWFIIVMFYRDIYNEQNVFLATYNRSENTFFDQLNFNEVDDHAITEMGGLVVQQLRTPNEQPDPSATP